MIGESRGGTGGPKPNQNWREPVEGVRSKDLKSDLEIMLTQQSSCVCSRGLQQGHKRLSEVPLTASAGWVFPVLGINQDNALEPGEKTEITSACQTYACRHRVGHFQQTWAGALHLRV